MPQRRSSQQNITGLSPIENTNSNFGHEAIDKYAQERFETEESNRRSSNAEDDLQSNGSSRFYDESVADTNFQKKETSSNLHQNESEYTQKEYEYNENPEEYSQPSQEQTQPPPQQQQQMYIQPEFTDQRQYEQAGDIYGTDEYNAHQYVDQQNYDSGQYGTNALQPTNEYDYQGFSQSGDGPLESLYQSEQYPNEDPNAEFGIEQNQPMQQSLTEPNSSVTNMQRYKTNGNNTAQRPTMSKQSTKKKFT